MFERYAVTCNGSLWVPGGAPEQSILAPPSAPMPAPALRPVPRCQYLQGPQRTVAGATSTEGDDGHGASGSGPTQTFSVAAECPGATLRVTVRYGYSHPTHCRLQVDTSSFT